MTRSKARPSTPLTTIAASTAGPMAARLSQIESAVIHGASASMTLAATKAPTAMKAPWPKFSTSIRPKVSVRPEAMMKIISPIARPATVSVTQLDGEPISGSAPTISAGISSSGQSSRASLMRLHAEAEQVLLQRGSRRRRPPCRR